MALKNVNALAYFILAVPLSFVYSKNPCDTGDTDTVLRFKKDDCGFSGKWKNELNSIVYLSCTNGELAGNYCSAVGNASSYYTLSGRYTMQGSDGIVGWSVAWNNDRGNSYSTTSWTGLYYMADDTIFTQWILASYKPIEKFWSSLQTNQDQFTRVTTD